MAVETADDRSFMLADFGITATYTPTGGQSISVIGIYDDDYRAVGGGEVQFALSQPRFMCRTADVPSAAEGDTLVCNGITYNIVIVMPDGTGMTGLMLERV